MVSYLLPETLDISTAEDLLGELKKAAEQSTSITIDGSKAERITTPAIQLLLALEKSFEKADTELHVISPSENLQAAFADLGLKSHLDTWSTANE